MPSLLRRGLCILIKMIIVFTGNGKGKTTAALGQAVRAVGRGKRVLMIQWIKGPWKSGEEFADIAQKGSPSTRSGHKLSAEQSQNGTFSLVKKGLGFVGILGDTLPREKHAEAARAALKLFTDELENGKWDLIILDEINVAMSLKLLKVADVLKAIKKVPPEKLVILTGRGAPASIIKAADLATEMRELKHPFTKGKLAKIAIEF
ncbi:MAG: cob(I)yrinic acid a,c-diamide adenosyltransferase [Candidatus Harrisonbacteria bacterium]|nr:cob(I)yrinic acid a,c-diamide adenosyltransferase [Candidatus Harrisonbacteria bacterium]